MADASLVSVKLVLENYLNFEQSFQTKEDHAMFGVSLKNALKLHDWTIAHVTNLDLDSKKHITYETEVSMLINFLKLLVNEGFIADLEAGKTVDVSTADS